MAMSINTNAVSLSAQRNLSKTGQSLATSIQRLSSGLRINSAKDDAAGLSITNRMTSQIRGTGVAIQNSRDAISLAQTGEGALQESTSILQRIRDLAVQSANDTNSSSDRAALQAEVSQLKEELNRIAETTSFNGVNLFDGSKQSFAFQTGANAGETVNVKVQSITTDKIGASATAGLSSTANNISSTGGEGFLSGSTGDALAAGDLVINGFAVGASSGSDDSASTSFTSSSAIAKAAAINEISDASGITAVVNANVVEGVEVTAVGTLAATAATFQINGVSIAGGLNSTLSVQANLQSIAQGVNDVKGQTGVTAEVITTDNGFRIDLTAEDGRNITLTNEGSEGGLPFSAQGLAAGSGGIANSLSVTYTGTFTLISEDGSDYTLSTNTGDIDTAGLVEGTYTGSQSQVVGNSLLATNAAGATTLALAAGDLVINSVAIRATSSSDDTASTSGASGSAIAKAAAINEVADQTGVSATVEANVINGTVSGSTAGSTNTLTINGVGISIASGDNDSDTITNIVDGVNDKASQTGVRAEATGTGFQLIADDGRNIAINGSGGTQLGIDIQNPQNGTSTSYTDMTAAYVQISSVTLVSGDQIDIGSNTTNVSDSGFRVGEFGSQENGQLVSQIDISTVEGANDAIISVDNALTQVDRVRSDFGAVQNRFESTISNLSSLSENLTVARGQILDTDFASETASLTKAQVLQQAGTAMLSQANALAQTALSLLG